MSVNMAPSLREQLGKDRTLGASKDDRGWTLLHHQALAGSAASVEIYDPPTDSVTTTTPSPLP